MKVRTLTAIIALLIFLPISFKGGLILMLLAFLLASITSKELLNMSMTKFLSIPGLISALAPIIIMLPQDASEWVQVIQLKGLIAMSFIVSSYTALSRDRFSFIDAVSCSIPVAYVGIGLMHFCEICPEGLGYILFAFLIAWLTDTGAYIFGHLMGKHKLWPVISPNKIIEGFFGGILCSILVPLVMQMFVDSHMNIRLLLLVTVVLSMFGQLDDLVESGFKRHFGVKGSGRIPPGHGGMLDRFDSFMFVSSLLNILLIQT